MKIGEKGRIFVIEDDLDLQAVLKAYYEPRGYQIECFSDPTQALRMLESSIGEKIKPCDLILCDLRLPQMDGMEITQRVKQLSLGVPIVLMTAHSSVETAIEAIQAGAYDFVVKPIHFPQLNIIIERALHWSHIQEENQLLRETVRSSWSFEGAVGKSPAMQSVFDLAKRVAKSNSNVLITGESGTGKEVIARAIHAQSERSGRPMVAINCSAIPENLLESELFGHAKGAFTGAADKKLGLFEEASDSTLFLDEIGDLSLPLQAKLLRVLQERKIKRIGENQFRDIDVRVLAATHKNLETEVAEGRFREDLYFRLNVIPIRIPPLRQRPEDVLPLAEHFFKKFRAQSQSKCQGFSKAALDHLLSLEWRGNVRELENAVERAVVLCEGTTIEVKDLPQSSPQFLSRAKLEEETAAASTHAALEPEASAISSVTTKRSVAIDGLFDYLDAESTIPPLSQVVIHYIQFALRKSGGVKEQASRMLGIDRKTLYRKLEEIESKPGLKTSVSTEENAPGAESLPQ